MSSADETLNPSDAARRLGISTKALRLYERRGLIAPLRTRAGWRAYGPDQMARAAMVVHLRSLGLGLVQVAGVLGGDARRLTSLLATHQAALEARILAFAGMTDKVRRLRADLERRDVPPAAALDRFLDAEASRSVAFDLPWPWGGERFELPDVRPLTFIVGPLGSGKTRFARRLAESLPGAAFLGLDRLEDGGSAVRERLDADPALATRVAAALASLAKEGAGESPALGALLAGLEAAEPSAFVVDMVEQGLDQVTQELLVANLRRRGPSARPLFLLTRSSAILDLDAIGPDEAIIFCPANHSPPFRLAPHAGAWGREAVATCLASPEVRARTDGVIAWRPAAA